MIVMYCDQTSICTNVRSEICNYFDFAYNGVRKLWHQHIPVLSFDRRRAHVLQRIMQGVADPRSKVWGLRVEPCSYDASGQKRNLRARAGFASLFARIAQILISLHPTRRCPVDLLRLHAPPTRDATHPPSMQASSCLTNLRPIYKIFRTFLL